jgi:hypothetical protein
MYKVCHVPVLLPERSTIAKEIIPRRNPFSRAFVEIAPKGPEDEKASCGRFEFERRRLVDLGKIDVDRILRTHVSTTPLLQDIRVEEDGGQC